MKNIIIEFTGGYDGMNSFAVEAQGCLCFAQEYAHLCIGVRSTYGAPLPIAKDFNPSCEKNRFALRSNLRTLAITAIGPINAEI